MATETELLERIKALVSVGNFRVRSHAIRHMSEEGFTEADLVEAYDWKVPPTGALR